MLYLSLCLIFLCASARPSPAEDGTTPPVTLANGLRLIVRERHTTPLIAIELWVRAGAREETADERGCAHFLEHTLFKGTTTRGPGEVDIAIENLGATLNAATGPDYARFYTTVSRNHLEQALQVLADIARNATLPAEEVERERGVILDELAERDSDPIQRLTEILYAHAFDTHPYRYSAGGSPEAIRACRREALLAFYHRNYVPERVTLALVGDLNPEQALTAAEQAFGTWERASGGTATIRGNGAARDAGHGSARGLQEPEKMPASPDEKTSERSVDTTIVGQSGRDGQAQERARRVIEVRAEGPGSCVGIGFFAPSASERADSYAAQVAAILLETRLNDGRLTPLSPQAVITAETDYTPRADRSLFLLTASAAAPSVDLSSLERSLLAAAESLRTEALTPAEVLIAERQLLGRAQFDQETDDGLAHAIGYADIVGGAPPEVSRQRIQEVTAAEVQRFAQRYLNRDHCLIVRLKPSATRSDLTP